MIRKNRTLILAIGLLLILAMPMAVTASPQKFIASISSANEVPPATGSRASGNALLRSDLSGYVFRVNVLGLSGVPSGVHLHAPADATQNAPVLITLCGNPGPAAVANCTLDSQGRLVLEGVITPALLQAWGVTGAQFVSYLNNGLMYVNVHTAAFPAGEARGQFVPFNP